MTEKEDEGKGLSPLSVGLLMILLTIFCLGVPVISAILDIPFDPPDSMDRTRF